MSRRALEVNVTAVTNLIFKVNGVHFQFVLELEFSANGQFLLTVVTLQWVLPCPSLHEDKRELQVCRILGAPVANRNGGRHRERGPPSLRVYPTAQKRRRGTHSCGSASPHLQPPTLGEGSGSRWEGVGGREQRPASTALGPRVADPRRGW